MKFFATGLVFVLAVVSTFLVNAELKSVAILFRHGERTNNNVWPKNGDTELFKELGPGELTKVSVIMWLIYSFWN